jgi:hypothetical protein
MKKREQGKGIMRDRGWGSGHCCFSLSHIDRLQKSRVCINEEANHLKSDHLESTEEENGNYKHRR